MPKYTRTQLQVASAIIKYGLRTTPGKLVPSEIKRVLHHVQNLAREGHAAEDIIEAARFGMQTIWKFTDKPWTAWELEQNITLAKAGASQVRHRGDIPIPASAIRRSHGGSEES